MGAGGVGRGAVGRGAVGARAVGSAGRPAALRCRPRGGPQVTGEPHRPPRGAGQPFTAPVSIPFLKCFWTNGDSTATGSRAITMTAICTASPDSSPVLMA